MIKYALIILAFSISSIFNIFLRGVSFEIALSNMIFQFGGSMILGFVTSLYVARFKEIDWVRYWSYFYIVMVLAHTIAHYLGILPE